MTRPTELATNHLSPSAARDLVIAIERLGIDTHRIQVDAAPASTVAEVGRVDSRAVGRPARRTVLGLVAGVGIGLAIGALVGALTTAGPAAALLGFGIAGLVIGGLAGLYSRLPTNTELTDVDTGQRSVVRIDVDGLERDSVDRLQELILTSRPSSAHR